MGRAIQMESDIDALKRQVLGIESSIKNIEKELTGLSKLHKNPLLNFLSLLGASPLYDLPHSKQNC